MSNRISIRALAVPGAAFMTQPTADGIVMVPSMAGQGVTNATIQFSVHALPVMLTSPNEPHWIVSFHDNSFAREILSVGITPTGQLAFGSPDGSVSLSAAGVLPPDGKVRTVAIEWRGDTGAATLENGLSVSSPTLGSPLYAVPSTVGVVSFLNGANATAKFRVAVHSAIMYWNETPGNVYKTEWKVTEGSGDIIACTAKIFAGAPVLLPLLDFNLYRQWMYEYAQPWPVTFDGDPGTTSAWVIRTPYTRRTRAATQYRKRRVSWLS